VFHERGLKGHVQSLRQRLSPCTIAPGTCRAAARPHRWGYSVSLANCLTKASLTGTAQLPKAPCLLTRYFPISPWRTPSRSIL
jgi:hypothetical protein